MFGFFFKNRAKAVMRAKIIVVYFDNFIRLDNGSNVDEWGNDWKEKSFNDVLKFFRDKETDFKIKAKFDFIPLRMQSLVNDSDNLFIYDAYSILCDIYFGKTPSIDEQNKLRYEYKCEKEIRGLSGLI